LRSKRKAERTLDQIRLTLAERDEFYALVYSDLRTPASVIGHLVDAYLSGAPIPIIANLGPPRAHESLTAHRALKDARLSTGYDGKDAAPTTSIYFALPQERIVTLRARARAQGASSSAVLRRFVLAYMRDNARPS
jgi:hypothetical protein